MRQLPRWITRKIALTSLILGMVLVLMSWAAYGQEADGSYCVSGEQSESTGTGTCSHNGGIDRERGDNGERIVPTLIGIQTNGWVAATRWLALPLGVAGTVLGIFGLGATALSTLGFAASPRVHNSDNARRKPKPIDELGLLHGHYKELDVRITATENGYEVEMSTPFVQGIQSLHGGDLPADRGIAQLNKLVAKAEKRRFGSKKAKAVEAFGTELFDAVFDGAIEKAYRDSVDFVLEHNGALRISLQVDEKFADIPWEYLYDDDRGTFLTLSQDTSLFRRIETTHATRSQTPIDCLRILSMSASPKHLAGLDVGVERARINEVLAPAIATGRVQLDFVDGGSLAALNEALKTSQPHIFHFAGHGDWNERLDDGVLFFEDDRGFKQPVTGRELGRLLHRPNLRLAIFNSCNAARPSTEDRFAGIASSLVAQGVPAAIGMQFNFDDKAAVAFGSALLSELAAGVPIDTALTDARLAVFTIPNDLEWGTPVLTTRVSLDAVLPRSFNHRSNQR